MCDIESHIIFDNDEFLVHNAFRAPGAADISVLNKTPKKVNYYSEEYSKMHTRITGHPEYISQKNLDKLENLNFVFMCLDNGEAKKLIIDHLQKHKISFIDTGIGIETTDQQSLIGLVRVTTGVNGDASHINSKSRISYANQDVADEYSQNIQIAELNALNAALAVIKWKKLCGFYHQEEYEKHSLYSIDDNSIINDDFDL